MSRRSCLLALSAAAAASACHASMVRASTVVAANPSAAWPGHVFAPYTDVTLWPTPALGTMAAASGNRYFTLAFLDSNTTAGVTTATWGGYGDYPVAAASATDASWDFGHNLIAGVNAVRAAGGDVMASFGGANGTPIDKTITDPAKLVAEYQRAIDTYRLRAIDFDVEGPWVADAASIARRSAAIATLQANNPGLKVWYTLPVLPTGLTADGLNVLGSGLSAGVRLDGVNVMAMDYGDSAAPAPAGKMGAYAIQSATSTFAQLKALLNARGQTPTDAQLWGMVGVTPMIGVNDDTTEVFTTTDAQQLLAFAQQKGLGYLSFWSATRDHAGNGGVDTGNSGIAQADYAFTKALSAYNATSSAAPPAAWANPAGGSWGTAANWSAAAVPGGAGTAVAFAPTNGNAGGGTVTLDGARTVGHLTFNASATYALTAGSLTLDDAGGTGVADVTVAAGSHAVAVPVTLAAGGTVAVAAGAALSITAPVGGAGGLTVAGPGTLTLAAANTYAGPTNVGSGTLAVTGALPATTALTVGDGATVRLATTAQLAGLTVRAGGTVALVGSRQLLVTPAPSVAGTLDLGTGLLDVPNGTAATLAALVSTGAIASSAAAAADPARLTTLAVVTNGANGSPLLASADGHALAATDVLVAYAYFGDANLDGVVNGTDYGRLDAGYAGHGTGWQNGDFNADGVVDGSDYTLADNAFNRQRAPLAVPAVTAAATAELAAVPEPGWATVAAAVGAAAARRRRRSAASRPAPPPGGLPAASIAVKCRP